MLYSVCSGNCPFSLQLLLIWAVQNWEAFGKVLSNHNVVVSIFLERRIWNWSSWSQLAELLLWRWYTGRHDAAQAAVNVSSKLSLPCQGMGLLSAHTAFCFVMPWLAKRRLGSSVPFPAPAWACLGSWLWGKATYVISQLREKGWFCSCSCLALTGKSFTGFLQQYCGNPADVETCVPQYF